MMPGTKSWKSLGRGKEEQGRGVDERGGEKKREEGGGGGEGEERYGRYGWGSKGQALGPVSAAPLVEF